MWITYEMRLRGEHHKRPIVTFGTYHVTGMDEELWCISILICYNESEVVDTYIHFWIGCYD